jgi:hypothetical protein
VSSDWFNSPDRTVPQLAAGGEYELANPPMSPFVDQMPPQAYSVPVYNPQPQPPQPQLMPVYPSYEYYQPQMNTPSVYAVSPAGQAPVMTAPGSVYDARAFRPPNSNAVYARAMAVGMKPVGPPLLVNPAAPSMQSQFRPAEYQEGSPQMIGNFGPEGYEVLENLGDNANGRPPVAWGPPGRQDVNGQDAALDDSNLDDLPEPVQKRKKKMNPLTKNFHGVKTLPADLLWLILHP